jgi:hypothetical protein
MLSSIGMYMPQIKAWYDMDQELGRHYYRDRASGNTTAPRLCGSRDCQCEDRRVAFGLFMRVGRALFSCDWATAAIVQIRMKFDES